MPNAGDLKRGMRVEVEGEPYTVVDLSTQTPSARGAATLVKTRLRHLRSGQLVSRTFKAAERLTEPDVELRPCQLLYASDIERERGFLRDGDSVRALFIDGQPAGIEVPNTVVLAVTECEPAVRGDTVNNVTKAATLETGIEVQVPLFVDKGEWIKIDTRTGEYVSRAKE